MTPKLLRAELYTGYSRPLDPPLDSVIVIFDDEPGHSGPACRTLKVETVHSALRG